MVKAQLRSRTDERSRLVEAMAERQNREMLKQNEEIRRFEENEILSAEEAEQEAEWNKEEAEYKSELEAERNRLESPQEAIQKFSEEYEEIWNNAPMRQKIVDAVDLAIAGGADNSDWRTYKKVGEKYRKRQKQLNLGQLDENVANREDVINQLSAQRHREMLVGNEYAAPPEEPETQEQIRQRFALDNPDFDGKTLRDAAQEVDQAHRDGYVKQGYADNSYPTYEQAAQAARLKALIRERQGD